MSSAKDIEDAIRQASCAAPEALRERIWKDAAEKRRSSPLVSGRKNAGRWITKYPVMKLAAAATIMTVVALGLNILGGPDLATVALADVAKTIEHTKNCVFKRTITLSCEDEVTHAFDSLVYCADNAVRNDVYDKGKIVSQVYYAYFPGRVLMEVDHRSRVFRKVDLAEEDIERLSPGSPRNLFDLILSQGEYKKLARRTVDGVLSEGFEFDDTRAMLRTDRDAIENIVTRLWVDVSTHLPVRAEVDCSLTNHTKAHMGMYDPQWDVELEPDFFEPKIPAGYVEPEQRGFIGINLENWPALKVVPGMGAEKAGVKSGDVVLQINGDSISPIESSGDVLNLLSGKIGEKVALTVRRGEQVLTFEIESAPQPK